MKKQEIYESKLDRSKLDESKLHSCIHLMFSDLKKYRVMLITIICLIVLSQLIFHKFCPFVLITGYPCPGCGMTRALLALLTLHFNKAYRLNPMIYIWAPFMVYVIIRRYYQQKTLKKCVYPLIMIGLMTIAVYIYRMLVLFPSETPLTYYEPNLIHQIRRFVSMIL